MKTTKSAICLLAAALLLMLPVLPQAAADSNGWSYVYTGNGKTLNNTFCFNKLPAGTYTFLLTIKTNQSKMDHTVKKTFTIK